MISDLTPEQVLAANVAEQTVDPESTIVEQQIKQAVKGFTFSMKLTAAQKQLMERFGDVVGLSWQSYLQSQIEDKILGLNALVGGPLITGPSFAKGSRINGPKA